MKRNTVYDILLGCCVLVFVLVLAGVWLNDERWAWAGVILFAAICMVASVLNTLNDR